MVKNGYNTKIYTGLTKLILYVDDDILGYDALFPSIVNVISCNEELKLKHIEISYTPKDSSDAIDLDSIVSANIDAFKKLNWNLCLDETKRYRSYPPILLRCLQ